MARFASADGGWRYYWVGSAWVPCRPGADGKCVDGQPPVTVNNTAECMEPKYNGCLSMS